MNRKANRKGRITKLIRIGHTIPAHGDRAQLDEKRYGYGIVRDEYGEDVFFVDSVVIKGRFPDLELGQSVVFELESGPLMRAVSLQAVEWGGIDQVAVDRGPTS